MIFLRYILIIICVGSLSFMSGQKRISEFGSKHNTDYIYTYKDDKFIYFAQASLLGKIKVYKLTDDNKFELHDQVQIDQSEIADHVYQKGKFIYYLNEDSAWFYSITDKKLRKFELPQEFRGHYDIYQDLVSDKYFFMFQSEKTFFIDIEKQYLF